MNSKKLPWILEYINPAELKPFDRNPRTHSEDQITKISNSIQHFGFRNPVLALRDGNIIIAGHGRIEAANKLKLVQIPVIFFDDMTYDEAKAYCVTDNRLAELASWDNEILVPVLEDLNLAGIDIELTGFTEKDIALLNKNEVHEDDFDIQAATDAIKEPITQYGDIWILGKHRLLCGDACTRKDIDTLMNKQRADLFITDPPYGVNYSTKNVFLNAINKGNRIQTPIKNDNNTVSEMNELWTKAFEIIKEYSKSGAAYYVFSPQGGELMMMMMVAIQKAGWLLKHSIIWIKNNHVLGRSDYHYKHEPILYGWKEGAAHQYYGGRKKFSTWFYDKPLKSDLHPTMKPVALLAEAINNSSKSEDIIIDCFAGSGSTLVACEQTGRIAYLCEIDQKYCDVIVKRYITFKRSPDGVYRITPDGTQVSYNKEDD
jgi:DNA modification methylase